MIPEITETHLQISARQEQCAIPSIFLLTRCEGEVPAQRVVREKAP